jgi:hypothetical protein
MLRSADCSQDVNDVRNIQVKVGSLMVTGLAGKIEALADLFVHYSAREITTRAGIISAMPDIFFANDVQLTEKQTAMGIPDGFSIHRLNSKVHGIVAYFRTSLGVLELPIKSTDDALVILLTAIPGAYPPAAFGGLYIPNGTDDDMARRAHVELQRIHVELRVAGVEDVYYTGDLNVRGIGDPRADTRFVLLSRLPGVPTSASAKLIGE